MDGQVNPFLKSIFLQPPVVCGKQLRPFSAFHACTLMLFDSPFMSEEPGEIKEVDLFFAVWVCSLSIKEKDKLFPEPDLQAIVAWVSEEKISLKEELAAFNQYLLDYWSFPEVWQGQGATKESGIPWPYFIVSSVLSGIQGLSEETIWDAALSKLVCYKAALDEQNGADIVSDKQKEMIAYLKEQEGKKLVL